MGSGAHRIRAGYLAISMRDCIVYGVTDRGSEPRGLEMRGRDVFPALACFLTEEMLPSVLGRKLPLDPAAGTSEHRHRALEDGMNPPLLGHVQTPQPPMISIGDPASAH